MGLTHESSFVYILSNHSNSVIYIGVTTDLIGRLYEHRTQSGGSGFTSRYNVTKLVYFEEIDGIENAIGREKQLKGWRREKKDALILSINPDYKDLSDFAYKYYSR
ncbi:GIY-YIG nuclease family protein [Candidatus Falkowbacteria bacterium]|nr:GIY-YIG nuclease family protein [Candidatus Falkowbacteria bacterium]